MVFRVIQGVCGGPLMALSQTLLLRVFPPKQQPAAMGLWAVTTLVAPVCGPILGGYLRHLRLGLDLHRQCPRGDPGRASSSGARSPATRDDDRPAPFDAVGLGLLIVWVGALQILLDLGKELDWFQLADRSSPWRWSRPSASPPS